MKILVIGSGGREHAIVWKLLQSGHVDKVYCAPGNAGIGRLAELVPINASDVTGLLLFAAEFEIDLTVVGPEQPLTQGIVDAFRERGLKIFGPTKAAAELEGSKVFAKAFMKRHGIPTAEFRSFDYSDRFEAERYISEIPVPIVIKADGLAAGKGVSVCDTKDRALEVLDALMGQKVFGEAGARVVIEEFLVGEEASVFAVTDGKEYVTLAPAQDHKRILDDDLGKNTGGMGAYAPAPVVTEEVMEKVKRSIIRPTLLGMAHEGRPYTGCLYVGLMITQVGPKVIEYNCRFGDPETQVVLPLLEGDLPELMLASVDGTMRSNMVRTGRQTAVCVVMASRGYPDTFDVGKQIVGLDRITQPDVLVFHAGTRQAGGEIVTAGGRVLGVTAVSPGEDLEATVDKAYGCVGQITFDGAYYRSDIGKKGVARLHQKAGLE